MASVNRVTIVGYLGNEPEVRTMPNGEMVANISVATSESWTDKNTGEKREITEWHRIVFYRRQAEIVGQFLHKGSQVYVEGRLRTRKWQDQAGQDRYTTEILGDLMQMLGSRNNSNSNSNSNATQAQNTPQDQTNNQPQALPTGSYDDELPYAPVKGLV